MKKNNILLIMCDQLRPDFLGCYGADFVKTPHIDGIAREGVQYNRALSHAPLCVPARAPILRRGTRQLPMPLCACRPGQP